jgi:hypothetical protein
METQRLSASANPPKEEARDIKGRRLEYADTQCKDFCEFDMSRFYRLLARGLVQEK